MVRRSFTSLWLQRVLHAAILLSLLLSPLQSVAAYASVPTYAHAPAPSTPAESGMLAPPASALPSDTGLYRTTVAVQTPADWARLEELGVVMLEERTTDQQKSADSRFTQSAASSQSAVLLADEDQLETLARLRFEPRGTDDLGALVMAHAEVKPWLVAGVRPLLERAAEERAADQQKGADQEATQSAVFRLSAALTPELKTALATLTSVDDDADGLTNTEELWWCTDPLNPNSDGDAQGYTDGQEVTALLDVTLPRNVRWGYGPPFGPPNAWPDFNGMDADPATPACNDGDFDTIPDYAEVYMVGSRVPYETTDNDKFDDGQELFGVTYCPGAPTNCGYGSYPAIEYWNFIKATMPNWVLPPGDSPFVAAFPVPEVYVEPGSWTVERVTTITTSEGEMTQTTNTYETSVTRGESTSIADTVTWNEWEEVSESVERPLAGAALSLSAIQAGLFSSRSILAVCSLCGNLTGRDYHRRLPDAVQFLVQDQGSSSQARSAVSTRAHIALFDIRYPERRNVLS